MDDKIFLAWAAGFFDGEGCVLVEMSKEKGCIHGVRTSLHATVTQTSLSCLQLYVDRFGGAISTNEHKTPTGRRWAVQYRWSVRNDAAQTFLAAIEPYTVVKREQIAAALQYPLRAPSGKKYGSKANPIPDDVMRTRLQIREMLQAIRASMKTEAKPARVIHG